MRRENRNLRFVRFKVQTIYGMSLIDLRHGFLKTVQIKKITASTLEPWPSKIVLYRQQKHSADFPKLY